VTHNNVEQCRELSCDVRWRERTHEAREPPFLDELARLPGVSMLKWNPQDAAAGLG
jgi:hypothetical protein